MSNGTGSLNPNRMGSGMGVGGSGNSSRGIDSGDMRYMNCDLRAKLAGYRSQTVSLANHRAMDDPNIGTILLHRLAPGAGNTVSANDLEVPKDARKAFDKGQESAKKGKLDEALKDYSKAVELYRPYASAWYELGKLQATGGDLYTARGSFGEAIKADPKYVPPYIAIAEQGIEAKKWKEVAEVTDRASKLDVFDYPQVYFFNAVANYNIKNVDAAEKSVQQAERLDTRHIFPQIYFLWANIMAIRHDYSSAADKFRAFLKLAPDSEDSAMARKQLDQVEKITATAQTQKQDQ
ncbi:TPR repeat-containing protein [Candidatus Sulfopaludibacter sp. SbA4]|nr:TPR repeat-containing protein [Candidatus Sulfopaludibacter sp. SbA4]